VGVDRAATSGDAEAGPHQAGAHQAGARPPAPDEASTPSADLTPLAVVENEFASVTISLDTAGHSPRLRVQDNETGEAILLSAIELASLCLATSEDRLGWLRVGLYRGEPE
jgi:hypothetical protein